jgi:hypothetical protein
MMGQRKLTGFEVDKIAILLNDLDKAAELIGCNDARQYFPDAVDMLASMKTNRTTDGKPWIEPQPEIGEGYRPATDDDEDRRDLEAWLASKWIKTGPGVCTGVTYRVPVDRIPTDEDAKQRPTVMVRDSDDQNWKPATLLALRSGSLAFVATTPSNLLSSWAQARFPYPGELD